MTRARRAAPRRAAGTRRAPRERQGSLIDKLNENTRVGERDDIEEEEEEEEDDLWRDNKENAAGAVDAGGKAGDAQGGPAAHDEELARLEREVSEIATKLQDYRTRVPKMLERKVEEEVVALRPREA